MSTDSVDRHSRREHWIDVTKGIGILLVVYGHVLRGLVTAGIVPNSKLFQIAYYTLYLFHMPLFFFLVAARNATWMLLAICLAAAVRYLPISPLPIVSMAAYYFFFYAAGSVIPLEMTEQRRPYIVLSGVTVLFGISAAVNWKLYPE